METMAKKTVSVVFEVEGIGGFRRRSSVGVDLDVASIGSVASWVSLYSAISSLAAAEGLVFGVDRFGDPEVGCPGGDARLISLPLERGEPIGPPYILALSNANEWVETPEGSGLYREAVAGEKAEVESVWEIEFEIKKEADASLWWAFCEGAAYPSHHASRSWEVGAEGVDLYQTAFACPVAAALWQVVDGNEARMAVLNDHLIFGWDDRAFLRDRGGFAVFSSKAFGGAVWAAVHVEILGRQGIPAHREGETGIVSLMDGDDEIRADFRALADYSVIDEAEFSGLERSLLLDAVGETSDCRASLVRMIANETGVKLADLWDAMKKSGADPLDAVAHDGIGLSPGGALRISSWWIERDRAIEFCRDLGMDC